jgi:hypothetical protein
MFNPGSLACRPALKPAEHTHRSRTHFQRINLISLQLGEHTQLLQT